MAEFTVEDLQKKYSTQIQEILEKAAAEGIMFTIKPLGTDIFSSDELRKNIQKAGFDSTTMFRLQNDLRHVIGIGHLAKGYSVDAIAVVANTVEKEADPETKRFKLVNRHLWVDMKAPIKLKTE